MTAKPLSPETLCDALMQRAERLRHEAKYPQMNAYGRDRRLELARAYERRAREVAQREFQLLKPTVSDHSYR